MSLALFVSCTNDFDAPVDPTIGVESLDVFSPILGWIVYRDGLELAAIDPDNFQNTLSLGPANNLLPLGWSADGTRLLLMERGPRSAEESVEQSVGSDLYIMTADGSVEQVTSGGSSFGGSLSPDGTAVVYLDVSETEDDHHHNVVVSDPAGGPPRVLATSEGGTWLEHAAWSPDGSQVAFVGHNEMGQTWSIEVVNVDGTGRHAIRHPDPLRVYGLAWSPDGSQLAFNGQKKWDGIQRGPVGGVFVTDADGSEPQQLTTNEGSPTEHHCCSLAWSPDGSRIAFLRNSGLTSVRTVAADGSDEQRIKGMVVEDHGTIAWNPVE